MKKFILTSLACALLFPSPLLAAEEDQQSSFVEMGEVEEFDDSVSTVALEAASTSVEFESDDKKTFKVDLPANAAGETPIPLVYEALPRGYAFDSLPTTITKSYAISKVSDQDSKIMDNVPIYVRCNISSNDFFFIKLESWNKSATDNEFISKKTLNQAIAQQKSPLYTTTYRITEDDLKPVLVTDGTNAKVKAYVLHNPVILSTETQDTLANKEVPFNFAGVTYKLRAGNFSVKANGDITVNSNNLRRALEELTETDGKVTGNARFIISDIGTTSCNIFNLTNGVTLNSTEASKIKVGYTWDTPIRLSLNFGTTAIETSTTYGSIFDNSGNPTKVANYLRNNWNRLTLEGDPTNTVVRSISALGSQDFGDQLVPNPLIIPVKAISNPTAFHDKSYSITFIDSTTDRVIKRDTRLWKDFFQINAIEDTLTPEVAVKDLIPEGYKIAVKQEPKSTSAKKSSTTRSGEFSLSIYQTNAIVYLTSTATSTPSNSKPEEPMAPIPSNSTSSQGSAVMYRLFNPATSEHLYTQDAAEKDKLLKSGEWNNEGHGWTAPATSSYPVYRVFNPNSGEHHYTKDKHEYDTLVSYGWVGEEKAFFSADDAEGKVALYRLYNPKAPKAAQHHYTVYASERDDLLKDGWIDEGTAWYGLSTN